MFYVYNYQYHRSYTTTTANLCAKGQNYRAFDRPKSRIGASKKGARAFAGRDDTQHITLLFTHAPISINADRREGDAGPPGTHGPAAAACTESGEDASGPACPRHAALGRWWGFFFACKEAFVCSQCFARLLALGTTWLRGAPAPANILAVRAPTE